MGIVSDSDFISEVKNTSADKSSLSNKSNPPEPLNRPTIVDIVKPGRKEGDVNVPSSLRQLISGTSINEGRQNALDLAKNFGISPSSVSAYSHDSTSTSTYDKTDSDLVKHNDAAKQRVSKRARRKLMMALNGITLDKIEAAKLTDISGVARDMSTIMKNMEPKVVEDGNANKPNVQFVFFKPEIKSEESYGIVHVRE